MKKLLLLSTIAFAAVAIPFAGKAETVFYKAGPFDKLQVRGDIDVVYRCNPDSTGMVAYDDSICKGEPLEVTASNGKVSIKVIPENAHDVTLPTVYVYSDFLTEAKNEGNGLMRIEHAATVPTFKATLIGNGKIVVSNLTASSVKGNLETGNGEIVIAGKCREASLRMVGTGTIMADQLEADKVTCFCLGSGTIGCWAETKLDVRGLSSTEIYYRGNPELKKVGAAKLIPLDESAEPADGNKEE